MKKQKQAGEIPLSVKQAAEIRLGQENITSAHARTGALTRQRAMLAAQLAQLDGQVAASLEEITSAERALNERITRAAMICGIDVDANPQDTGETWNFDYAAMSFKRQSFTNPQ